MNADAQYQAEVYLKAKILSEMPLAMPIIMANERADDVKSFLSFTVLWLGTSSPLLSGGTVISEGQIQMALVYMEGQGSNKGQKEGGQLSALFPYPSKLWVNQAVRIDTTKPPEVKNGFRIGSEWRVPVVVDFRLFS